MSGTNIKLRNDRGKPIKHKAFEEYLRLRRYSELSIKYYMFWLKKLKRISLTNIKFLLRRYKSRDVYYALLLYCKFAQLDRYIEFLKSNKPIRDKTQKDFVTNLKDIEINKIESYFKSDLFQKHKWSDEFLLLWKIIKTTGLRLREALSIRLSDIDLNTNTIYITVKRGKRREIFLPQGLIELIQNYYYSHRYKPHNPLFRKRFRTYQYYFERVGLEALGKKIHAHQLRHTFAVDFLKETKNIRLVQKALGHSDVKTTTIYLNVADEEYKNKIKEFASKRVK